MHNDHAGALSQFVLYLWFIYHKKVNVISKCKNIKKYLEITGVPNESYNISSNYLGITFIKTNHVKELDTYGFALYIANTHILYTGDTCELNPFIKHINNCDEFYVDVSRFGGVHLKFEDVFSDLKNMQKNGHKIILMHIDDIEYISKVNNNELFIASPVI